MNCPFCKSELVYTDVGWICDTNLIVDHIFNSDNNSWFLGFYDNRLYYQIGRSMISNVSYIRYKPYGESIIIDSCGIDNAVSMLDRYNNLIAFK
jgi:hypothetical protein